MPAYDNEFKVINVDTDRVKEYIMNNNDEFPRLKSDLSKVTRAPKLSIGGYVNTLKKAQKDRQDFISEGGYSVF